jgi:hypothetical protein
LESFQGTSGFDEDDEGEEEDQGQEQEQGEPATPTSTNETKRFEVFENQRRSLFLEWGKEHLFSGERSPYSDETGEITYHYKTLSHDNEPPAGYEWVDLDWQIDRNYTNTDGGGWVYGIDFTWIRSNLAKGESTTSSSGRSARRRKFVRRMKKVNKLITHMSFKTLPSSPTKKRSSLKKDKETAASHITSKFGLFQLQMNTSSSPLIMSLCQERETIFAPVRVPWEQVSSCDVITPTVLKLRISVQRYFGENPSHEEIYRPAEVEVFVIDCPSEALAQLVIDRQRFYECRENISCLISSGTMTGQPYDPLTDLSRSSLMQMTLARESDATYTSDNKRQFMTEDLSLGSRQVYILTLSCYLFQLNWRDSKNIDRTHSPLRYSIRADSKNKSQRRSIIWREQRSG